MPKRSAGWRRTLRMGKSSMLLILFPGVWIKGRLRRAVMLSLLICLISLSLTLTVVRKVAGAASVRAVSTGYEVPCRDGAYKLALVSVSDHLQDDRQTPAESLSLILIPQKEPTPSKLRIFSIYSFGAGNEQSLKRDDDGGTFALREYNRDEIQGNIANFFQSLECSVDTRIAQNIADVLKQTPPILDAEAFASAVEDNNAFQNRIPLNENLPSFAPSADRQSFGKAVRAYSAEAALPGEVVNVKKLQEQVKTLTANLEKTQKELTAANLKITDLELKKPAWLDTVLIALVLALLLPLVVGLTFISWKVLPLLSKREGDPTTVENGSGKTESEGSSAITQATPATSLEAAKKLDEILKNIEQRYTKGQPHKRLFVDLKQKMKDFQKHYPVADTEELKQILRAHEEEMKSYEGGHPEKYSEVLRNLHRALKQYYNYMLKPKADQNAPDAKTTEGGTPPVTNDGASPPASAPAPTGQTQPAPVSALGAELDQRFEILTNTLIARLETNQGRMGKLWPLCVAQNEAFDGTVATDLIFERSKEALTLLKTLREKFNSNDLEFNAFSGQIEHFFNQLNSLRNEYLDTRDSPLKTPQDILPVIVKLLKTNNEKLGRLGGLQKEFEYIEQSLGVLRQNETVFQALHRIISDQKQLLSMLGAYRTDNQTGVTGLVGKQSQKLKSLDEQLKAIESILTPELKGNAGTAGELVNHLLEQWRAANVKASLAAQLETERDQLQGELALAQPQVADSKRLATEVAHYLNFNTSKLDGEPQPVITIMKKLEHEPASYRRLRLSLSAACLAMGEACKNQPREGVIKALRLESLKLELEGLLQQMEELNGVELWKLGISSGINWFHKLFRADLLLQTYFSGSQQLYLMQDAIAQACAALRTTLQEYGVQVLPVKLLENPVGIGQVETYADPELRELPEVKSRVDQVHSAMRGGGFVVDVLTFPLKVGDEYRDGCVIVMNPTTWHHA